MPIFDNPFDYFFNNNLPSQEEAQRELAKPFTPEEEDSAFQRALGAGRSGLSWIAGSLDKALGGRAIRGALGGQPRELLSIIPFSDTMGLTDEQERVSGEDLARKYGLLRGYGVQGRFEMRDLVGPAIEAALDPGTYLTFGAGALTKAGGTAKKLGIVPKSAAGRIAGFASADDIAKAMGKPLAEATQEAARVGINLDDLVGKPLGSLAALRVPGHEPFANLGTGPTAEAIASKMGGLYQKALYSGPGRTLAAMFDPKVHGATHPIVQRNWRLEADAARARDVARRRGIFDSAEPLLADPSLHAESTASGSLRGAMEGTLPGPHLPAIQESVDRLRTLDDAALQRAQAAGLKMEPLSSVFDTKHAARSPTPVEAPGTIRRGLPKEPHSHQLHTGLGPAIRREEILDVPGGTSTIEAMVRDPRIGTKERTLDALAAEDVVRKEYLQANPARLAELEALEEATAGGGRSLTAEEAKELLQESHKDRIAGSLAAYLGGLDESRLNTGLFGNDVIGDTLRAQEGIDRSISRANVASRTLADAAIVSDTPLPGTMSVGKILPELGLHHDRAGANILNLLSQRGIQADDIAHVRVPADVADAVRALIPKLSAPEYLRGPLGLFDDITNLTRTHMTAEWPGKHVRDAMSSTAQNLQAGAPGAITFGGPTMRKLRAGNVIEGLADSIPAFAGLTDDEATRLLSKELYSQGSFRRGYGGMGREGALAPTDPIIKQFALTVPGIVPEKTLAQIAYDYIPKTKAQANPLNVAGWGGRTTSTFAPVAAGREFGDLIDDVTRGGMFADLRRQGFTPDAAGKLVEQTHFDYLHSLTDFERRVMRRLIPFYSWQKNVIPQQLGYLLREPGGLSGQAIRVSDAFRQAKGFQPPYLGGGLAIPVGDEEDGTQRYLTKMDLPWESPFELLSTGPKGGEKSLMKVLGQLNPLIKGPLEFATGRQFYSGRNLDDLYSRTGIPLADQVIMNSPGARLLTTASSLADPRKDWIANLLNLGTGLRLSDVDMERQRQSVGLDLMREKLRSNPNVRNFEEISVSRENLPKLSPEELELYRLYKTLQQRQRQEAAKRKAASQS